MPATDQPPRRPIGLAPGARVDDVDQDERKYATGNPVVQRLIARWLRAVRTAIGPEPGRVVDVGVGEGLAIERLVPAGTTVVGVEYRQGKVRRAVERLPWLRGACGDGGMLPLRDRCADTVTCIEVLEHLPTYRPAVGELARATRARCVVSVPWEPWFRLGNLARGKNLRRLGNDPEHIQWFTPRRLRNAMAEHFAEVRIVRCFPWVVAIGSRPLAGSGDAAAPGRDPRAEAHGR